MSCSSGPVGRVHSALSQISIVFCSPVSRSYIWSSAVFRKLNTHPWETLTSGCSVEISRGTRLNKGAVSLVWRCWIPFARHSTSSRTLNTLRQVPEWSMKPISPSRDPITGQSETNLMLDGQDDRCVQNIVGWCSSSDSRRRETHHEIALWKSHDNSIFTLESTCMYVGRKGLHQLRFLAPAG